MVMVIITFALGVLVGLAIAYFRQPKYKDLMYYWMTKYDELFRDYEEAVAYCEDLRVELRDQKNMTTKLNRIRWERKNDGTP